MSQTSLGSASTTAQPKRTTARVAPQGGEPKENRDPNDLNQHIHVDFSDILAEPETTHSLDCVWYCSETLYSCCLECWYKLFTFFCGCWIAIFWAWEFVPTLFAHVWFLTPFYKVVQIVCGYWCKSPWFLCVNCCCSPVARSFAPFFRFCGNGLREPPDSPTLFPRAKRRPRYEPKPDEPPQWNVSDRGKIAKSVKRQLGLF